MMKISFYSSKFCPRCYFTRKYLQQLTSENADLTVEEIEFTQDPGKFLRDGVIMIPTLKFEGHRISGVWLSPHAIRNFLVNLTANNSIQNTNET